MAAAADTSKTRVAFIPEAAWGVTPASPTFQNFRRTNGNMRTKKTVVQSEEIQLDRNVREVIQTGQDAEGSYDFEMSYGTLDDLLAGVLQGVWSTDVLTVGSAHKPFTFEETVDLGGGSFSYSRFNGCEVDRLSLNIQSRQPVKGTIALMGQKETLAISILSGATYTAANTKSIATAVNFANLSLAGLSPLPRIKGINFQIANGLRIRDGLGDLHSDEFGTGQSVITGQIEALFKTNALYQKVLDHGGGQLAFTLGNVTTEKYTFDFPAIRFLDGARVLGGRDGDVMVSIPWQAEGTAAVPSMSITRGVA